tara:strand:- start:90 stop:617 length:528 start_codon:yes stop_codon:yes gene_type:complete
MKIVITGGPGTGKTSIINKLENIGHTVFHESSREIIQKYKKLGHDQLFLADPIKFSEIILEKRIQQFEDADKLNFKNVFFDRGIPDIFAYLSYKNVSFGKNFDDPSNNLRYDYVFIAEPWKEIFKNDEERYESYEELKIINKHIKTTYSVNGYDYFILPEDSIEQRVNFIIKTIK